jgi:hypothetical protein
MTKTSNNNLMDRIADRVDLAIDFFTLGQYGLESAEVATHTSKASARYAGCEGGGRASARLEALAPARSRGCEGLAGASAPHAAA